MLNMTELRANSNDSHFTEGKFYNVVFVQYDKV